MPSAPADLKRFAERVLLARQAAAEQQPGGGTTGLELEWNLLDASFQPLRQVGSGPAARSFADVLRQELLPDWLAGRTQLEVFHWMIEWTTAPHPDPWLTVAEGRLLEACQINALARAAARFGDRLYAWHGNLLAPVRVGPDAIPGGWNLAKRRYLETCVALYGAALATAGIHANLSLPEPLLAWDFLHQPRARRRNGHLDSYKNRVYIDLTRRLRSFAALFIALTASTPLRAGLRRGRPVVRLTGHDSVRLLTFPSPEALDVPGLYRSHADYLRRSYDLVRRGLRFGNNNWTPVRARSFSEPVERLISISSGQLEALYAQGLYAAGADAPVEAMARRVVEQNLLARIDLPMARVEVRTDEGGHPFELDVANLAFKELLLLALYHDPALAPAACDDEAGLRRARRNEARAARAGLRATIEDPWSGAPIGMRPFLRRTLAALEPLAEALGLRPALAPLHEMAAGAPNTAERLRAQLRQALGRDDEVPTELLRGLAEARERELAHDIEQLAAALPGRGPQADRLRDLWGRARDLARHEPAAPIRFRPAPAAAVVYSDKTAEIVDLARALIRIPSVSGAPPERRRPEAIRRAATLLSDVLQQAGLDVRTFESGAYPALLARFPGAAQPGVLLSGHFDVVEPEPDDGQFEPRLEGDYLWGRGACDMKTVVATYAVWMRDVRRRGAAPSVGLLLVGNEEIGEGEPDGTPHVLAALQAESGYRPGLVIAGERTGERGDEALGSICIENRGLLRLEVELRGARAHTGFGAGVGGMDGQLYALRAELESLLRGLLSPAGADGWGSQIAFPFVQMGEAGVFNVSAERAVLGIEARPIPADRLAPVVEAVRELCARRQAALTVVAAEDGVACDPDEPYLRALIEAVQEVAGAAPVLGRKLAATSARFAPPGRGVVWGQSGVGPHAAGERHFVPSILPYYRALDGLARRAAARPSAALAAGPSAQVRG